MDQVIKKKQFNEKIQDSKNEANVVYNVYSKYNAYRLDQLDDDGNPKYPSDPTNLILKPSQFSNF